MARDAVLGAVSALLRGCAALAFLAAALPVLGLWLPLGGQAGLVLGVAAAVLVLDVLGRVLPRRAGVVCRVMAVLVLAWALVSRWPDWRAHLSGTGPALPAAAFLARLVPVAGGILVLAASDGWVGRMEPAGAAVVVAGAGLLSWFAGCPWRVCAGLLWGLLGACVLRAAAAGVEEARAARVPRRAAVSSLGAHVLLGGLLCCLCVVVHAGVAGALWLRAGRWLAVHLPAVLAALGLPMSLRARGRAGRGIRVFCLAVVAAAAAWAVRLDNVPQAVLLGAYVVFGWLVGKGRFERGSLARWAAASVLVPLLVVAWRDPRAVLDLPRAAQQVPAAASLSAELLQLRGAAGADADTDAAVEALDLDRGSSPVGFGFPGEPRVLFEVRARDIGSGYFRVTGLERYVGGGWERVPGVPPWGKWPAGTSKRLSYEVVFREAFSSGAIPALWRPAEVSGGGVDAHGDAVAGAGSAAAPGSRFRVVSEVPDVGALVPHLRAAGTSYPAAVRQVCLEVPASVPGRVRELARQIVSGCRTPYEKAAALERFLRTRYPYTEQGPEPPPGRDFVDFFLFGVQKGKCNHFATAMAVMCRCVDVPARVAVGCLPAGRVAQDRYVFTTGTLHMWVEAYFPGVGWVPFDPTGESAGGRSLAAVPLQRHPGGSGGPDGLPPRPEPDGSAPPSPRQREAPAQEKPEEPQRQAPGQEAGGEAPRQPERRVAGVSGVVQRMGTAVPWRAVAKFGMALAAVGVAGLAWFAWRHRKLVRRAGLFWVVRRRVAGRRLDLAEVFLHVCRRLFAGLERVGLGRDVGETVLEAAWRVSALTGDEGLVRAAWAFSAVRYGGERPGEEALKFVCALRRRVRSRSWRKAVALRLREVEWDGEPES